MAKHERRFKGDPERVQKWRLALTEVANLSGWHFTNGYEFKLIQQITEAVSSKLNRVPFRVADHPVGLESRVSELSLQIGMGSNDVRMIGIYGFGGTGKTTLAKAMYNAIADQFEGASFLDDVREISSTRELLQLQEAFLGEILGGENIMLRNVDRGVSGIFRLCSKKVLLILDNVQKLEHLKVLAGAHDWFGSGSRIIITTRDKHLLIAHKVDILYEMKGLMDVDALKLFSWHAFRSSKPKPGYECNACRAIRYANGLPLAVQVIGCNLFSRGLDEWKSALDNYEKIPPNDILNKLKISYDDLVKNEKEIFLDMACFFRGEKLAYVERLLDACGFYTKSGIGILVDKCLMKIENNKVKMHDLIQEMGREIVTHNSWSNPGRRSRLWFHDDILEVLTNNTGTQEIEAIMMNPHEIKEVQWSGDAFKKMPMLRMLVVRNALFSMGPTYLPSSLKVLEWIEYPSPSLPEDFGPKKLVVMCLPTNHLALLKPFEAFYLTYMDFRECQFLTSLPDMSSVPSLTTLLLDYCTNLVEIHDSIGFLGKLVTFSARGCTSLGSFPHEIRLTSLEYLNLRHCCKLQRFPDVLEKMENTLLIDLRGTAIEYLPSSVGNISGLQVLDLSGNKNLRNLPCGIGMLTNLITISLRDCPQVVQLFKSNHDFGKLRHYFLKRLKLCSCGLSDEELPIIVHCFPNIEDLSLAHNNLVKVSACFKELYHLKELNLDYCELLEEIEGVPPTLLRLSTWNCNRLRLTLELDNIQQQYPQVLSDHIPKCFKHYLGAGKISFWYRKKFPDLPLCLVFGMPMASVMSFPEIICDARIRINGVPFPQAGLFVSLSMWRVEFMHLHSFIKQRDITEEFEKIEWKHVEILFEPRDPYGIKFLSLGTDFYPVLVFGKKPNNEDIRLGESKLLPDWVHQGGIFYGSQFDWITFPSTTEEFNAVPNELCSARGQGAGNGTIMTWDQTKMEAEKTSERDQLVSNEHGSWWPCSLRALISSVVIISSVVTLHCFFSWNSP